LDKIANKSGKYYVHIVVAGTTQQIKLSLALCIYITVFFYIVEVNVQIIL